MSEKINIDNLRKALAAQLPAIKSYVDNKEVDVSPLTRRVAAVEAVVCDGNPELFDTLKVMQALLENGAIPYSLKDSVKRIPYSPEVVIKTGGISSCANLEFIADNLQWEFKDAVYSFNGCKSLKTIPSMKIVGDLPQSHFNCFYGCESLESIENLPADFFSLSERMQNTFYGCKSLVVLPEIDTANVGKFHSAFSNCSKLERIEGLDASGAHTFYLCFDGCPELRYIKVANLGKNPRCGAEDTHDLCKNTISPVIMNSTVWGEGGEENLASLKSTFGELLFDRVAAGYEKPCYVYLRIPVAERLGNEQIAQMQAKGYTVIVSAKSALISQTTFNPCDWEGKDYTDYNSFTVYRAVNDPAKDQPYPPVS